MFIVGYVLKPQGIKGEIKIKTISPDPERFKTLKKILVQKETVFEYSVDSIRIANKFVILKLSGINSREDAEILRGCDVLIDESELIELSPGEYYVHELIGCRIISEKGLILGELTEVSQYSSNDVYVVRNEAGDEILLPATKEVIKQVDIERKQIVVHLLEGLLD